jgi:hypothetical protein
MELMKALKSMRLDVDEPGKSSVEIWASYGRMDVPLYGYTLRRHGDFAPGSSGFDELFVDI